MRTRITSVALAAATLVSSAASAQTASAPDTARAAEAERLFREGRVAVEAGDLAHACPKFAESEKLDPAPGTLLSLADCEERSKSLVKAREHYLLAASGFPKKDPRRAFATAHAQAIDKRVAHATLRLADGAPADATVQLGDLLVPRTELGTPLTVDPGELRIIVTAPGRKENTVVVTLGEDEAKDVALELGPVDAPRAGDPGVVAIGPSPNERGDTTTASSSDPRRTVAYVLLGVGAASLIAGGVTGILAAGKAGTVHDHCDASNACDQEGVDAASSGRFLAPFSTVTLIAGAVLAGAGVYFYVASANHHKPPPAALLRALQLRGTF